MREDSHDQPELTGREEPVDVVILPAMAPAAAPTGTAS
jgi:hypothetical protein